MSNIILKIYEYSGNTLLESDVYFDKRKQLIEWREKFLARSQERIDTLYNQLSNQLDGEINNFAENHYEDERAGEHWQQRFQSLKFDQKYQELLQSLANECERKRKALSDELAAELPYLALSNNTRTNIQMGGTTPWGKYAAFVLPNLLMLVPGIGWGARLAIGVGSALFSFLFEDKQEKIREAKAKLRDAITPPSYEILDNMYNQVIDTFNNKILAKGIDEFSDLLAGYQFMLARLGKSQYVMANTLFGEFSNLNFKLLVEANNYKGVGSGNVTDIPRIPGEKMLIFADNSNLDTKKLSDLLGENVSVMKPEENFSDTVKKVLGSDFDVDYYPLDFAKENKNAEEAIAVIPKNKIDATNFKLAQQIAGVPIITEITQPHRVAQPQSSTQSTASSGNRFVCSDSFSNDFARIKEFLANRNISNEFITDALNLIEQKAKTQRNQTALNFVADYRKQLNNRR